MVFAISNMCRLVSPQFAFYLLSYRLGLRIIVMLLFIYYTRIQHMYILYVYICLPVYRCQWWLAEGKSRHSCSLHKAVGVWLCADGVISLGRCLMDWINAMDDGDGDGKGHQTTTLAWTIIALIHLICAPLCLTIQIPEKNSFRWYIKSCWGALLTPPLRPPYPFDKAAAVSLLKLP